MHAAFPAELVRLASPKVLDITSAIAENCNMPCFTHLGNRQHWLLNVSYLKCNTKRVSFGIDFAGSTLGP